MKRPPLKHRSVFTLCSETNKQPAYCVISRLYYTMYILVFVRICSGTDTLALSTPQCITIEDGVSIGK
jgi:hypothetical protein